MRAYDIIGMVAAIAAGTPWPQKTSPEWDELRHLQAIAETDRTPQQRIRRDLLLYGLSYARHHPDGTIEHIPAEQVVVNMRGS